MKTEKELTLTADVEKLLSINNLSIVKKPWSKTKNLIIDGINYLIPFCAIVYTLMAWSIFEYYIYFSNIVVIILLLLALFTYLYPKYSKEFDDQGREKKKLKFSMASTTGYWNTFYAKGITYTTVLKVISLQSVVICLPLFLTGFYFSGAMATLYAIYQIALARFQYVSALYIDEQATNLLEKNCAHINPYFKL